MTQFRKATCVVGHQARDSAFGTIIKRVSPLGTVKRITELLFLSCACWLVSVVVGAVVPVGALVGKAELFVRMMEADQGHHGLLMFQCAHH